MDSIEDLLRVEVGAKITIEYLPDTQEFYALIRDNQGELVDASASTIEETLERLSGISQEWLDSYDEDASHWQIGNQQHEDNTLYYREVGEGIKRFKR